MTAAAVRDTPAPAVGVVLCGGDSTRMGTDKASIGDPPWAHRVATALRVGGCGTVELQGADPCLATSDLAVVADLEPGGGPAAAIVQAASRHAGRSLVVAACDLALLDAETVEVLLAHAGRVDTTGTAPGTHAFLLDGRPAWSLVVVPADHAGQLAVRGTRRTRAMSLGALLGSGVRLHAPPVPERLRDLDTPSDARGAGLWAVTDEPGRPVS